jgi:PncC family amidohydrolase
MAKGIRKLAKTDIGLGITGIAGPTGGTARKPIGTVYIAAASNNTTICKKHSFKGSRTSIRNQATHAALKIMGTFLETSPLF